MDNIYIKKEDLKDSPATYDVFDKLFKNQDIISLQDIIVELEEAYWHAEELEEQLRDMENDLQENYKYIGDNEYYGVSESMFH